MSELKEKTLEVLETLPGLFRFFDVEVRKGANIRNRYNQAPHQTQDTNGKVTVTIDITNESQEVTTRHQQTDVHESITKQDGNNIINLLSNLSLQVQCVRSNRDSMHFLRAIG